jgi:large subunit ribosomal protein L24
MVFSNSNISINKFNLFQQAGYLNRKCVTTAGVIGNGKKWTHLPRSKNGKPIKKIMQVKRGDSVVVVAGDDSGKVGKVIALYPKTGYIRVSGVNIVTKHVKPTQDGEKGKIRKSEGVLHQSKVMHWSDKENIRSRIGHRFIDEKKVRYLIKSGEIIA